MKAQHKIKAAFQAEVGTFVFKVLVSGTTEAHAVAYFAAQSMLLDRHGVGWHVPKDLPADRIGAALVEIGYDKVCKFVRELKCHKSQAKPLGSRIGVCAGCNKIDWMSALQLHEDSVLTRHEACDIPADHKWKQPPVHKPHKTPEVGDKVHVEYKGKLFDGKIAEPDPVVDKVRVQYTSYTNSFEYFDEHKLHLRVRIKKE